MTRQTGLIQNDDMIQALAPDGADHALDVSALPGRARGGQHWFDAHGLHLLDELLAENPVPVAQQITWCRVPGKGLPELMSRPCGGRMRSHGKVQNATAIVGQHQEHIQDLKADRRHRKEIHRHQALDMIVEKCPPSWRRWSSAAEHVFADAGFAHIEAQLEQFTMDARRTPERILTAHRPNQSTDLLGHDGTPRLALPNFPSPKEAKALPMPAEDGRGLDEKETGPPMVPDLAQPSPQESIGRGEFRSLDGALQSPDLRAECEHLQLQGGVAPEGGEK